MHIEWLQEVLDVLKINLNFMMNKRLFLLFTIICATLSAQQEVPPQGINYQAVIYSDNGNSQPGINSPGQVLWNEDVTMRFSIYLGATNPTMVYQEMHLTSTDEFGLVSLVIGQGTPQGTQLFESIDWGAGEHFLQVEIDKEAGLNFQVMSYQKLWSVPYALYSGYAGSSGYADSSSYADIAGNGITDVIDNGDGTLTFNFYDGSTYTTDILSGLEGPMGPAGADGLSAYEIWLSLGNTGTEQDFLNGLTGPAGNDGTDGEDGLSAYEIWLSLGNTGTEADFLNGLIGPAGNNGVDGADGVSAYEIWLSLGNTGTEQDFLNSLTGPAGNDGVDGADGLSAYEIWLSLGNTGTEQDFLNGLTGPAGNDGVDGVDGLSAYEVWLSLGNTGTEQDFLNGLTGPQGPAGATGPQGPQGDPGSFPNGTNNGDMLYWDGTNWTIVNGASSNNQILTWCDGIPTWTPDGNCPGTAQGTINTLDCASATTTGTLTEGQAASGVSVSVPYTGGDGGTHNGQTVSSNGVTGLTATLMSGTFANGNGTLSYTISGTPSTSGSASFALNIGGQSCSITMNVQAGSGSINSLNCASATTTGTLTEGQAASGVSVSVPYTGGDGGTYNGQTVSSTVVTGLTATLTAGTFANGSGSLSYTISGTPNASGTASFVLNIGGQTCTLIMNILSDFAGQYPSGSFFCTKWDGTNYISVPTSIIDVTNPITGEIWMDRNLGASRAATNYDDSQAFGNKYQWGRFSDGHQCVQFNPSSTTIILSPSDQPGHDDFIVVSSSPYDWRSPQNDNLWQGVNGINNPCPAGYRLPSEAEFEAERLSWSQSGALGALNSPLKLSMNGFRQFQSGSGANGTIRGYYWTSTVNGINARTLQFNSSDDFIMDGQRAHGFAVRCIKD